MPQPTHGTDANPTPTHQNTHSLRQHNSRPHPRCTTLPCIHNATGHHSSGTKPPACPQTASTTQRPPARDHRPNHTHNEHSARLVLPTAHNAHPNTNTQTVNTNEHPGDTPTATSTPTMHDTPRPKAADYPPPAEHTHMHTPTLHPCRCNKSNQGHIHPTQEKMPTML